MVCHTCQGEFPHDLIMRHRRRESCRWRNPVASAIAHACVRIRDERRGEFPNIVKVGRAFTCFLPGGFARTLFQPGPCTPWAKGASIITSGSTRFRRRALERFTSSLTAVRLWRCVRNSSSLARAGRRHCGIGRSPWSG